MGKRYITRQRKRKKKMNKEIKSVIITYADGSMKGYNKPALLQRFKIIMNKWRDANWSDNKFKEDKNGSIQ